MKKQEEVPGQNSVHSDSKKQAHANAQPQQNNPTIQTAPVPHNQTQEKQQTPLDEQQQIKQEEQDYTKKGPIGHIEYQLKTLQKEIHEHRTQIKKQNACWKFGFDSTSDYGSIWSSVFYWRLLIEPNKKICTNDMHFLLCCEYCSMCQQKVGQLENLKIQWEKMIVQEYECLNNS